MERINGADTVDIGGGRHGFRGQNAGAGINGTEVTDDWLNAVQEEIMKVIEAQGMAPAAAVQLAQGIARMASSAVWFVDTGVADAYALAPAGTAIVPSAYFAGMQVWFRPAHPNTGPATIAVGALAAVPITRDDGTALQPADITDFAVTARYHTASASFRLFAWSTATVERLVSNKTFYVRTDGDNANDGLENSAARAFKTLSGAYAALRRKYAASGNVVTLQLGLAGSYEGFSHGSWPGVIAVRGDPANPQNYLITAPVAAPSSAIVVQNGFYLLLEGVRLTANAGSSYRCAWCRGGRLDVIDCEWWVDGDGSQNNGILATYAGNVSLIGTHKVIATQWRSFLYAQSGSSVVLGQIGTTAVINLPAAKNWNVGFVEAESNAQVLVQSLTFTGSTASGSRYQARTNGVINSAGGGASFFPGNSAGAVATGGQYV